MAKYLDLDGLTRYNNKVNAKLDTKADVDGNYEDMAVGQLLSNTFEEDKAPYNFRTSGGTLEIGDREYDTLVGGTVAFNQLVDSGTSSVTLTTNHKALTKVNGAWSVVNGGTIAVTGGTDMVIDLTQMFGSTIADYIYSLEQATAGSGVAYFRSLFPKDYYDYNAGQLMSVKALSHKMVGFNQWDEEWLNETKDINTQTGEIINSGGVYYFRTKNYIPVFPNTVYYNNNGMVSGNYRFFFYDKNKAYISYISKASNATFTTPANTYYMLFRFASNSTTTYQNNICINLHWDGERDGEYEAYSEHIYPLDSDLELRGIPKLDANNNLYYEGDTYESDGTVTRKYGYRAYQSGDESLADAITDGTNTVYKLTTPTTETADAFENPQLVDNWGTEEYTDSREVQIPVGHITKYPPDLKAKLESAPDSPSSDGDYILRHSNGENSYVALTKELPAVPTTDGTYVLKATVSSGVATLSWVAEE